MDFGNPIIYACPSCGKSVKRNTYMSYTVRESRLFSDCYCIERGKPYDAGINLAKCPHCGAILFLHKLKGEEKDLLYSTNEIEDIELPELEDLINADKNNAAKTSEEQFLLRLELWRAINNTVRNGDESLVGDALCMWEQNNEALLKLLIKKIEYNDDDRDDEESAVLVLIAAELCRNLGRFDECLVYLEKLSSDYFWQKALIADRAGKKKRMVFEMHKSEGCLLSSPNGETWQSWECGAETSESVFAVMGFEDFYEANNLSFYGKGPMRDYELLPGKKRSNAPWCSSDKFSGFNFSHIDNGITSIGSYAFYGCKIYKIPSFYRGNITRIGKSAFSRSSIDEITIPNTVAEIEEKTCAYCSRLEYLTIENGVKHIGERAFFGCVLLSEIKIPASLISIGKEAFASCNNLTEIVIGAQTAKIGNNAFAKSEKSSADNSDILSVTNNSLIPQDINANVFGNSDLSQTMLYVPEASIEAYKAAAVWKNFGIIAAITV